MQISKGVEWATHAVSLLSGLPEKRGLSAEALAEFHKVPPAYMAKQLQALSKAGIVKSSRGAGGGYRLAKPATEISLWDIVAAIEGSAPAFKCTEVRQNGPCALKPEHCKLACPIASAFLAAERVYRDSLRQTSVADINLNILATSSEERVLEIMRWTQDVNSALPN
jgi:Rrf2 family protein